jgi:hypothetical protein
LQQRRKRWKETVVIMAKVLGIKGNNIFFSKKYNILVPLVVVEVEKCCQTVKANECPAKKKKGILSPLLVV